jgi:Protein of unknown function (DUF3611)
MSNSPQLHSLPPSVERAIPVLRRFGWISFWIQVILGVVAGLIFLFAVPVAAASKAEGTVSPESGPSGFLAVAGLVALFISVYWSSRYPKLAQQLAIPEKRPSKSETLQLIERGLIINLVGMLFSLLAAETIAGVLLAKALQSSGVTFSDLAQKTLIQPLDIFVVLGNTHTLVAHFTGLLSSLWLLKWLNKS